MGQQSRRRSTLHLQLGQETIYLLLTIAVFIALILAARVLQARRFEDPPIITLSEAQGFYFTPGSADLTPAFANQLKSRIAPKVHEIADRYDAHVVEVLGHTDEVPLGGSRGRSDLDGTLVPWFAGQRRAAPVAADNAGLGMARAVAVSKALREAGLSKGFVIVPLSAGAFLKPDDTVTDGRTSLGPDERRRRIEIRVRRTARQVATVRSQGTS